MALNRGKLKQIYATLQKGGYAQDYDTFERGMSGNDNYNNRKQVYDLLTAHGAQIGDTYEDFMGLMQSKPQKQTTAKPVRAQKSAYDPNVPKFLQEPQEETPEWMQQPVKADELPQTIARPHDYTKGGALVEDLKQADERNIAGQRERQGLSKGKYTEADVEGVIRRQEQRQADALDKSAEQLIAQGTKEELDKYEQMPLWQRIFAYSSPNFRATDTQSLLEHISDNSKVQSGRAMQAEVEDAREAMDEAERQRVEDRDTDTLLGHAVNKGARTLRGLWGAAKKVRTWDMGEGDMRKAAAIFEAAQAYDNGTATPEQEALMEAAAFGTSMQDKYGDALGGMYGAGSTTTQMLPFMLQIAMNPVRGVGGAAQKAATRGITKFLEKRIGKDLAKKWMGKAIGNVAKGAARLAGDAVEALGAQTAYGMPTTLADYYDRMTGTVGAAKDEDGNIVYNGMREGMETSAGTAFAKAFGNNYFQYQSEMVSEYFTPVLKVLNGGSSKLLQKFTPDVVSEFVTGLSNNRLTKLYNDFAKKTKWGGTLGEYAEEVVNNIENAVFIGDMDFSTGENGVFNPKMNWDTFLGVGLFGGVMSGIRTGEYAINRHRLGNLLNDANTEASTLFGEDKWQQMKDAIDAADDKTIGSVLTDAVNGKNQEQAKAIAKYAGLLYARRGENLAEMKNAEEQDEGTPNPLQEAYDKGYAMTEDSDKADAQTSYDLAVEGLQQSFGTDNVDAIFNTVFNENNGQQIGAGLVDRMRESGQYNDAQMQAIDNFMKARATYYGMAQHMNEEMESQVKASNATVRQHTNPDDGMIYEATLFEKNEDNTPKKVYVVKGSVATADDGKTVVASRSSDHITIVDAATGEKKMVSPDALSTLELPMDAEQVRQEAENNIRAEYTQKQNDILNGTVGFNFGDTYTMLDDEGVEMQLQVTADPKTGLVENPDGTVNMLLDGQIAPIPKEVVQAAVNNSRRNRLAQQYAAAAQTTPQTDATTVPQQAAEDAQATVPAYEAGQTVTLTDEDGQSMEVTVQRISEDGVEVFDGKRVAVIPQNDFEAMLAKTGSSENSEATVVGQSEEQPQTARSRVPKDEKGNPIYEQAEPDAAWDAIVEETMQNTPDRAKAEQIAQTAVGNMVKAKEAALKRAEKATAKTGTTMAEMIAAEQKRQQNIDNAKAELEHWKKIAGEQQRRKDAAEAKAKAEAAKQLTPTEERLAQLDKAKTAQEQLATAKRLYGNTDYGYLLDDLEPQTVEELVANNLGAHTLNWEGMDGKRGLQQELGLKRGIGRNYDTNAVNYFIAPNGQGASVDEVTHAIWEARPESLENVTTEDIKNAMLDMLATAGKATDISRMTLNNRIAQIEQYLQGEEAANEEHARQEAEAAEQRAAYQEYMDYLESVAQELLAEEDADRIRGIIADEMADMEAEEALMREAALQGSADYEQQIRNNESDNQQSVSEGQGVDNEPEPGAVQGGTSRGQTAVRAEEPSQQQAEAENQGRPQSDTRAAGAAAGTGHADGGVSVSGEGSGTVRAAVERGGQGNLRDAAGREQGDLAQTGEVDENGHPFVMSSDGTTTFGYINADSGLTPAPIKLSEGFNNKDEKGNNIGYGRVHIDEGHGEQIREAGYGSIEEFVEKVARDYKEIRIGRDRKSNQTYMLLELHDEKHNATLYVELSRNGEYWNVNSGGIFKKKYTDKNDIVWPLPTVGSDTNTDTAEVVGSPAEAVGGETADRGGNSSQPISSGGKVTSKSDTAQGNGEKKVRGRKQVQKAFADLQKAYADGNMIGCLDAINLIRINTERGDSGAITAEEQDFADKVKEEAYNQGYEVSEMEGKPYIEGMRVEADFINDESLPLGAMVIRTVKKPQILKDGQLVRKATILVAQNLDTQESQPASLQGDGNNVSLQLKQKDNGRQEETADGNHDGQPENNGSGVVGNTTRSVSPLTDRGVVQVYGEEMAALRSEHLSSSERNRRGATSERLVELSKKDGTYIPVADTKSLGDRLPKSTGESTVYINTDKGKVYKVKDPYAKAAMKNGVEPEDAIFEHLVHNLLFPETRYTLEGISDVMGDVRIVLSQDYIKSVGRATQKQIEEELAKRGLVNDGKYSYGNEYVSVTDVEGDNVLVGEDGTLYFIDPIINFKKPLKDVLDGLSSKNTAQRVGEASLEEAIENTIFSLPIHGEGQMRMRLEMDYPAEMVDKIMDEAKKRLEQQSPQAKVEAAEQEVDIHPTDAQKEAGNYKKGHVEVAGFDITIENPKDSVRSGTDADGKKWSVIMQNTYGYIRGTEGVDGDHIDVFLANDLDTWDGQHVYVVDQYNTDGTFDEHKVMLGFNDAMSAELDYECNYDNGFIANHKTVVTEVSLDDFKKWIDSSHRKTKPFAEYKSVQKVAEQPSGKWYGTPEEMPGYENMSRSQKRTLLQDAAEAYRKGNEEATKDNDFFGGRQNEMTYEDFVHAYREEHGDFGIKHDGLFLPALYEHLKGKLDKAVETRREVRTAAPVESQQQAAPIEQPKRNYTVEPAQYTTKRGKVLDMQLVKFDFLQASQQKAAASLARSLKGWWDKSQKGFMLRNEEDVKTFVDAVNEESGETLADHAPLSLADLKESTPQSASEEESQSEKKEDVFQQAERIAKEEGERLEKQSMAARIGDWLSKENLSQAYGKTRDEIFEEFGNELEPIASVPAKYLSLISPNVSDPHIYCGKGYFIDHALRNHGKAEHQVTPEEVDASQYLNMQSVLDNPDSIKETTVDGKRTVVFIKKIGRYYAELTQAEEDGKIVLHKSLFNQKKEPYAKLNDIRQKESSSEGGASSISHADNSAPAISLQSRGDEVSSETPEQKSLLNRPNSDQYPTAREVSADKVTANSDTKQEKTSKVAKKSSATSEDKIDDYGEKIAGARKDMLREIAKSLGNANLESFITLPFAKAFKRPNLKKAVETGVLRDGDARFAEAVMAAYLSQGKPKELKRSSWAMRQSKQTIQQWAERCVEGIDMLKKLFDMDEAARDAYINEVRNRKTYDEDYIRLRKEQLKEWNPGHKFEGTCYGLNPIAVFTEVYSRLGYDGIGEVKLPVTAVEPTDLYDGYRLKGANGKRFWPEHTLLSFEDVVEEIVYQTKKRNGDADTDHPTGAFHVRGIEPTKEITGYNVRCYSSLSARYPNEEKAFPTKEEAEKYAKEYMGGKKGRLAYVDTNTKITGYKEYEVQYKYEYGVDNATYEYWSIGTKYDTQEEARAAITERHDELNEKVNARIAAELDKKGEKREKKDFVDVMIYSEDGFRTTKYAVVLSDKYSPKKTAFNTMPFTLKDGFSTRKEAEEYIEKHRTEWEGKIADIDRQRKEFVYFGGNSNERTGEDYRKEQDVTAEQFATQFGFRGVQFGNWANQNDRQAALNNAFDSFMDLAKVLGVSPRALSLNGELGIAFGARGSGGAMAHYEKSEVVINLTKTQGAGALAHEWWHALDNYFARQGGVAMGMTTENRHIAMREELRDAFNSLVNNLYDSDYDSRSKERGRAYWGTTKEETARMFEKWVKSELESRGENNDFLTSVDMDAENRWADMQYRIYKWGLENNDEEPMGFDEFKKTPMALRGFVYPSREELETFGAKLRNIFNTIQERVDAETGKTIMYHRGNVVSAPSRQEAALCAVLGETINNKNGISVITDVEVGQRVMDLGRSVQLSKGQKRALETATLIPEGKADLTVVSSADGAKILQKVDAAIKKYEEKSSNRSKTFIGDVANALEMTSDGSASQYATFETKNGKTVTIRMGNHNATVKNFDVRGESDGISIVIAQYASEGITNNGVAHLVEFYYSEKALRRADGKPLVEILKSIKQSLYSGEYNDTTGLAEREEVNADRIREHRVYHGSGADFEAFDHSHMSEGEGNQAFGWGTYVTEVEGIGKAYAEETSKKATVTYKGLTQEELRKRKDKDNAAIFAIMIHLSGRPRSVEYVKKEEIRRAKRIGMEAEFINTLKSLNPEDFMVFPERHLYMVEIPDDNGENYLGWDTEYNENEVYKIVERFLDAAVDAEKRNDFDEADKYRDIANELAERMDEETASWDPIDETVPAHLTGELIYYYVDTQAKTASQILSKVGYTGIKYAANYFNGGNKEGKKNYAIFNEADAKIVDHVRFFKTANGEAYGFTVGGKIYIDPRIATAETPIHEYAHLWAEALRQGNPKEWKNIVELMKGTSAWDKVRKKYPELKSDSEIADEVLAHYSGQRGAERLREEQRSIAQSKMGVTDKAAAISALENVKRALKKFWKAVADFLHIHYTSAEEVADRVLSDLLNGVNPTTFAQENTLFRTSDELTDEYGTRWLDEQTTDDGRHTTQVKNTINSYKKFGEWVKRDSEGRDVSVLDASSGLGLGTQWMRENGIKADDVEPYPSENREKPTFGSYAEVNKKYDYIISNAVLNVIPDDWRANVLHDMADKMKDGGKMVINVRGAQSIREQGIEGKTKISLDNPSEILVLRPDGSIRAYQKGFTKPELKEWVERELGNDYTVEVANMKNAGGSYDTAVVVTKTKESNTTNDAASRNGQPTRKGASIVSSSAKLVNKSETSKLLADLSKRIIEEKLGPHELLHEIVKALSGITERGTSTENSKYFDLGGGVTLRVSDHQSNTKTFADRGEHTDNYGLVIKVSPKNATFKPKADVDYLEYVYYPDKLVDGQRQKAIVDGLASFLSNGNYSSLPEPDRVNTSGKFRDAELQREGDATAKTASEQNDPYIKMGADRFTQKQRDDYNARQARRVQTYGRTAAESLAEKLHLKPENFEVLGSEELRTKSEELSDAQKRAKGFFNTRTGKITVILGNHQSVADVEKTVLHEAVAHYGLRQLFGKQFDTFLDNVYAAANREVRTRIAELAKKHKWNFHTATEEYLAGLAEDTDFERAMQSGWWTKIKELFMRMLHSIGFEGYADKAAWRFSLSDNELRYILWRSYENLAEPGRYRSILGKAADVAKQYELGVGNYAKAESGNGQVAEPLATTSARFDEELQQQIDGTQEKNHIYQLGMPSPILRSTGIPRLPIQLNSTKLKDKATLFNHDFDLQDVKGLVEAIQEPLAIFAYGDKGKAQNLIVNLTKDGKNFIVGLSLNPVVDGKALEINSVRNVFPKDNAEWLHWIEQNKALYLDKEKIQALIAQQRTNLADVNYLDLDSVAKIVNDFVNPSIEGENVSEEDVLFRDGDDLPVREAQARDAYERRVKTSWYQTKEAMQDSMLGLKEGLQAILQAEDGKKNHYMEDIAGFENPYLGENRLSSVNQAEMEAMERLLFKPMYKEVAKLAKGKAAFTELTDYMMAKHGLERNEVMASREAEKEAREEFAKELRKAERAAAKDAADQKAIDELEDVKQRMHEREEELYYEKRGRDYAGLTALMQFDSKEVGLAEAEAQKLVKDYEADHDTTALWKSVKAVNEAILSKQLDGGIISKETYADIKGMYKNYIPLRGFEETTSADKYAYLQQGGQGYNAPIKKAKGRSSKADNPFAYMLSMAESGIMGANRNVLVKQRMLNFALNHPSDLVSVSQLWLKYDDVADEWVAQFPDTINDGDSPAEVEQKVKAFEAHMVQLAAQDPAHYAHGKQTEKIPYRVVEKSEEKQHQVIVKRFGQDYVLTINGNPRIAQALNGKTNPDSGEKKGLAAFLRAGEAVNRELSAFYTTRNPDFVLSNFLRDALYSNTMAWVKESPKYALRFHKNFAAVNPGRMKLLLKRYEKGTLDMNDATDKMFYQFMMNGGETGYTALRDIEQHKKDAKKGVKRAGQKVSVGKGMEAVADFLDEWNRAVENCARFAAFKTSREMGRTIDRCIYDAKEISVNFNKKGSGAKFQGETGQTWLGNTAALTSGAGRAAFVFWNAALQGTTNFARQFKRHPAKALAGAASLFLLGAMVAAMGGDGDDDDKNAYYNLPEYVRRSNFMKRVGGQWVSLPLPVEYRLFYGMGELAASVIGGKEHMTDTEIGLAVASQLSQALPLDFLEGGGDWKNALPSAFKPIAETAANKSWTGMPIYKDTPYNKEMPEWTKAYKSANKYLVGLSEALNEATGGDKYTSGAVDINPAQVEYFMKSMLGGVTTTIDEFVKTGETLLGEREYDPRSFMFLNRVVKNGDERTEFRAINNEYFRLKEEAERTKSRMKHYDEERKRGDERKAYRERYKTLRQSPQYERLRIYERNKKRIDELSDQMKEARTEERMKRLEQRLNERKKRFVNAVEATYEK